MVRLGIEEVRRTIASLLEQVEHGEEIVITQDGEPITRLIPSANKSYELTETHRAEAAAAVERMRERAKSLPQEPFDWKAIELKSSGIHPAQVDDQKADK